MLTVACCLLFFTVSSHWQNCLRTLSSVILTKLTHCPWFKMRFHYFKALQHRQALSRHHNANDNTKAAMVIIVMETVPWSSQSSRWSIQRGSMVAGMWGPLQRSARWQVSHSTTCNTMPARCFLPRGAQDDFTMQCVFIYVCVCAELHSVGNYLLEWLTGVNIGLASTKVSVSLKFSVSRRCWMTVSFSFYWG